MHGIIKNRGRQSVVDRRPFAFLEYSGKRDRHERDNRGDYQTCGLAQALDENRKLKEVIASYEGKAVS